MSNSTRLIQLQGSVIFVCSRSHLLKATREKRHLSFTQLFQLQLNRRYRCHMYIIRCEHFSHCCTLADFNVCRYSDTVFMYSTITNSR